MDVVFHYVAVSGRTSQLYDTVPDSFEDTNGNGVYDPGNDNSNWLIADTRLVKNTTQIANPCLECDPNCTGGLAHIPPQSRIECDPVNAVYCQPAPCGPWPQPLPTSSSASGASLQLDNFYKVTSPPVNVNLPTQHRGFKNTYAIKQWHGVYGFNSYMRGDWPTAFNGNGDCQTPHVRNTPDTTKYRKLTATAKYDGTGSYRGTNTNSRHAICVSYNLKRLFTLKNLAPPG